MLKKNVQKKGKPKKATTQRFIEYTQPNIDHEKSRVAKCPPPNGTQSKSKSTIEQSRWRRKDARPTCKRKLHQSKKEMDG